MVEDRVEERLRLTGPGTGRDQRGQRTRLVRPEVRARQPLERRRLVAVGGNADVPAEDGLPPVGCGTEREPQPQVRPLEDAVLAVAQELGKGAPRVVVGERERRRQIVEQAVVDLAGLGGGE